MIQHIWDTQDGKKKSNSSAARDPYGWTVRLLTPVAAQSHSSYSYVTFDIIRRILSDYFKVGQNFTRQIPFRNFICLPL